MSDFIENKLKKISVHELQTIIAKAISEVTEEEFEATISAIDYGSGTWPEASFKIRLAHPIKFGDTT
jgi:hypothetical protein